MGYFHAMPLRNFEFRENRYSEGNILLKGVSKPSLLILHFFRLIVNKVRHRRLYKHLLSICAFCGNWRSGSHSLRRGVSAFLSLLSQYIMRIWYGSRMYIFGILSLGTRWKRTVIFTPWLVSGGERTHGSE